MANFNGNLQVVANGNIVPMSIVMMDSSRDNAVIQATGSTAALLGISQAGPKIAPGLVQAYGGTGSNYAAVAGDPLETFTNGDVCSLTIGACPVTAGDLLTSDSNGLGKTATVGQYYIARALGSGNPGECIKVFGMFGKL